MHCKLEALVNANELTTPEVPATDNLSVTDAGVEALPTETRPADVLPVEPHTTVDPVRAAAGRLGGQRVHRLAELGREYEREHGLKPGRQRLKQLIQLGKKYE